MSHTALARKYRPRRFAEVATQEHVSETLRRGVATGRVGHAYLFCGPRGVGKTTLARVLAMSLNCASRQEDGEPCGTCSSCQRIWSGTTSLDVVEIDAASNRGVDDARALRERAMYAPSEEERYKVYIVDEAHMLTREAWNALLKILEEPPPRVIFIFATTEPQKIEQTAAPILSRCQRFDFRRVGVAEIVARLEEVLEAEGASASGEALRIIARKADGGMRDGLSLLDQILSLSEGEMSTDVVRRVLGIVEEERYLELFDLLGREDRGGLFQLVEDLLDQGYDLVEFYHGLMESLRTLLRLRVAGGGSDLPDERLDDWTERAGRFHPSELVRMLGMASELETGGSLRRSAQPRVLLELLLLRFSYLDRTVEMEELLEALRGDAVPGPPAGSEGRGTAPKNPGRAGTAPGGTPASEPSQGASASEPPPDRGQASDLLEAWNALLEDGTGVPPGLSTLLKAGKAHAPEQGVLELVLSPGPALERLQDEEVVETLTEALSRHFQGDPRIRVRQQEEASGQGGDRISTGEVRRGRLQDLLEKEPGLRPAVEELDLELLD